MVKNTLLGKKVMLYEPLNIYGAEIGDMTKIGTFVEIQSRVKIGSRCKISSHSFICSGVQIEDEVFIGHGVIFTNDKHPHACNADGSLKSECDYVMEHTFVRKGATIGSGAVILPGIEIGEGATIGAGAIVTKSVKAHTTVVGNPAKELRKGNI